MFKVIKKYHHYKFYYSYFQHFNIIYIHIKHKNNVAGSIRRRYRRSLSQSNDTAVEIRDVSASWIGDPNFLALKSISLRIRRGKLCAIIGAVGSGKVKLII